MQPRTFCFIAVFVGSVSFALATPLAVTDAPAVDEQKVLLDCRHSDYRTYIKCLKRHKRHHSQHGDSHTDGVCMEACLRKCEEPHDCDKQCSHCIRRSKHVHQIITEYETDCDSGDCSKRKTSEVTAATNITTKIDIKNIIGGQNGTGTTGTTCCPTCRPPIPCQPPPFLPHLTLVPQLTLGLGLGLGGGCVYPNQWNCPPIQNTGQDCSGCGYPFTRLRCDISCYPQQGTPVGNVPGVNNYPETPCQSPYCVGGYKG